MATILTTWLPCLRGRSLEKTPAAAPGDFAQTGGQAVDADFGTFIDGSPQ